MKKLLALVMTCVLSLGVAHAQPKQFTPTKPIEVMTPWPVGGTNDVVARIVADIFTKHGWESKVANVAGAGGVIGMNQFTKARPDGHQLMVVATSSFNTGIANDSTAIYNSDSVVPVYPVAPSIQVLYARADAPFNNYEELKAWIKADPKRFNIAFYSAVAAPIFTEWARLEKLPQPNMVVYKGSGPALTDVLGGHLLMGIDSVSVPEPHVKAGKLKIIGGFDPAAIELIRKVQPESPIRPVWLNGAHPDLVLTSIFGVWAPAGTPEHIVKEMHRVIDQGLKDPEMRKRLGPLADANLGGTPEMLRKNQQQNLRTMKRIMR